MERLQKETNRNIFNVFVAEVMVYKKQNLGKM